MLIISFCSTEQLFCLFASTIRQFVLFQPNLFIFSFIYLGLFQWLNRTAHIFHERELFCHGVKCLNTIAASDSNRTFFRVLEHNLIGFMMQNYEIDVLHLHLVHPRLTRLHASVRVAGQHTLRK